MDEGDVVRRAAAAGVGVYPLGGYRAVPRPERPGGLVLGYSCLGPADAERAIAVLARVAR
jgi:DNA-binding transcriptional MocR family regulator